MQQICFHPFKEKIMRILLASLFLLGLALAADAGEEAGSDGLARPGSSRDEQADCRSQRLPAPQAEWTFMLFMNGDNNLEGSALTSFILLAQAGSTSEVNIVAQLDRIGGHSKDHGDWKDTRRFHITQGMTPDPGNEVQLLGESDMAVGAMAAPDDGSLEDFIRWDHGNAWVAAGQDWTSDDKLYTPELQEAVANAFSAGFAIDLIGFDECNMAMLEVAFLVQDFSDVMVGSAMIESNMWPYDRILGDLTANPKMDAATLGSTIVKDYAAVNPTFTLSAMDLSQTPPLVDDVSGLALAMHTNHADITTVRDNVRLYNGGMNSVDLFHLAELLIQQIPSGDIHDAAVKVNSRRNAVIATHGPTSNDNGIAIYFPKTNGVIREDYINDWLPFSADGFWDDFLCWFHEEPRLCICGDIRAGGSAEVRIVGAAGEPAMLARGGGVQDPPQQTMYGDFFPTWPIVRYGPRLIPGENIVIEPVVIPSWCRPGDVHVFQALIGLEGDPGSVLTNHVLVTIE